MKLLSNQNRILYNSANNACLLKASSNMNFDSRCISTKAAHIIDFSFADMNVFMEVSFWMEGGMNKESYTFLRRNNVFQ